MVKLGQKVKDVVTGFEGIVTSRCEYMNGCVQLSVAPKVNPKEKWVKPKEKWFDESQLRVLVKKPIFKLSRNHGKSEDPGGGMRNHPF